MKRIGILGDIGSGKSFIANCFGYPVFNADREVEKIYKNNRIIFKKLKKRLPLYFSSFPIKKIEVIKAILANKNNLEKIISIIHLEVRKKLQIFLKKNRFKKIIILDIPLLLENKINKKGDILVFIVSNKSEVLKRLKKRKNFSIQILRNFKKIQLPLDRKKNKSDFIIRNNFKKKSVKVQIKHILNRIL
tara:strand:- start:109 stop:678 length:570 start_codon:yes stop_codon:yes gene_type:complete